MPTSIPEPPYDGSCLCGAVRVRITAPPLLTVACHCGDCQKLTASAFSMTTMFPVESFSCAGEVVLGGLKTPGRAHYYCASCLGFVYSQLEAVPWRVNVRTAMLDGDFQPFLEVMAKDKQPWVTLPVAHSYQTVPESAEALAEIMAAYAARAG